MASLIPCPVCSREISSAANACPGCGHPAQFCSYCSENLATGHSEVTCPRRPPPSPPSSYSGGGGYGGGGRGCQYSGISCFPAGTMVLMGDHTEKPIEDVQVGEVVVTPFGPARVAELYRPLLGNRPLYEMRNGRKLRTSSEQAVWGRSPGTGREWWTTRDMAQWKYEAETGAGSAFSPEPVDLTDKEGVEWEFAVTEGWNMTSWKRVEAPDDLQLYDLFLDSGGAYFADGYLVKTFPDIPSEVWKRYGHGPVVSPLGAGDSKDDHAPVAGGTFGEAVLV